MNIFELIDAARHNRNLYKSGQANYDEVRGTTVGYRIDPINHADGQTYVPPEESPSGNCNGEYTRVLYYKSEKRRNG